MLSLTHKPNHSLSEYIALDLDHTIIKPKSGKTLPKGKDDWTWWNPIVPNKLQQLAEDNFHILIITNQSKAKVDEVRDKILDIFNVLDITITALICYGDNYRKPCIKPIQNNHFYPIKWFCGDAVGRPGDFANTDALFAFNLKIPIITPNELFLDDKQTITIPPPLSIEHNNITLPDNNNQVILMCGYPASGKSHFARCQDKYTIISLDIQKTKKKVESMYLLNLGKKPIIVDNTFPSAESRSWFIQKAKEANIQIGCVYCNTHINVAYHLNHYRCEKLPHLKFIPKIVYYVFRKNFQHPSTEEGLLFVLDYTPNIEEDIFTNYRFPLIE